MWQNILVFLILALTAFVVVRSIWRFFKKSNSTVESRCDSCKQICSLNK